MITRDEIVSTALLELGEVNYYNDNKSQVYERANFLLNNIIKNTGARVDFLFNSTTVPLTLNTNEVNALGEYRYNLPNDFLGKISFINFTNARIENEFIYSTDEGIFLQYCRNIDLSDYPQYMLDYLIYALATKMAETSNKYKPLLKDLNTRLEQEKRNVYNIEFTPQSKVI